MKSEGRGSIEGKYEQCTKYGTSHTQLLTLDRIFNFIIFYKNFKITDTAT